MNWVAITLIIVLALTTVGGGVVSWLQTDNLGDAEDEIDTLEGDVANLETNVSSLEGNVSRLEGNVSTLEGNVANLETDLSESEATVVTLQTDLEDANTTIGNLEGDLSTQRTLNSTLSEELKTVEYPRHFSSTQELADWSQKDKTDEEYKDDDHVNFCYILQVRALRDGFILPVTYEWEDDILWTYNTATIGEDVYVVYVEDDSTIKAYYLFKAIPSHPLSLD